MFFKGLFAFGARFVPTRLWYQDIINYLFNLKKTKTKFHQFDNKVVSN